MNIFITLIVIMILQVYAYAQTYQIVYIKYEQFWDINPTSIELLKNSWWDHLYHYVYMSVLSTQVSQTFKRFMLVKIWFLRF